MALRTRICNMLGIQHPILLAGMGRASTPELAAAVSNAGGRGRGRRRRRGAGPRRRRAQLPVGTMALIPQVVGAGGIGDGRGVAAALMLGAEGAWIGTAFLATEEAGIGGPQKRALVEGDDEGTTISRSVTGKPARIVKNRWAQAYAEAGIETLPMRTRASPPPR